MRLSRRFHAAGALAVSVAVMGLLAGCSRPPQEEKRPAGVRVTTLPLFRGDTARIEPHLGLSTSACVKVDVQDRKLPILLEYQVWHNGKVRRTQEALYTTLEKPTEVTFSWKELDKAPKDSLPEADLPAEGKVVFRATGAVTGQTSHCHFAMPPLKEKSYDHHYQRLPSPAELTEDKPVTFWGMYAGEGAALFQGGESLEDKAKRVELAVVLRLRVCTWDPVKRR